jgi:phosphoribosylformimino-5-aminoimidazole carboxamide ribotide isomerase
MARENPSKGPKGLELIPVLDLMGGVVVHARRGQRAAYRPIETPLCAGSNPLDIAAALLDLAPFHTLYVADLDAIRGTGEHGSTIARIAARFPGIEIWVDAGSARPGGCPVIGTETLADMVAAKAALADGAILSLDHDAAGPMGPAELHATPALWPSRVIAMSLARVGADEGPDFARLEEIQGKAGHRNVYVAGGVRGGDDLERLTAMGTTGVLLASALHDGRIGREQMGRFG